MLHLCHILLISLLSFTGSNTELRKDEGTKTVSYSPPDFSLTTDTAYFEIPFTRAGNLIVIKAKADSTEGNFILDTGAPGLVLNLTYFRDYPITTEHDAEQTGVTGTGAAIQKTQVSEFSFGSFKYHRADADLVNLGHIENSKNIRILGLIGLEFFRECELIIDFENNVIHLQHLPRKIAATYNNAMLADTSQYSVVPINIMDNRIITNAELGGKKLKMIIDCAAESNILNSKLPNKVLEFVNISRRVKLTGSGNRQLDALYGDVSNMKVGSEEISKLPVLITNLENTCFAYNGCVDGVLGFDFLSLHKIGFNFVKRKMYIWK